MLNDISKKIALKKTFFITQLDTLLNTLQQEYQDALHKQRLELSLLKQQNEKYEQDIKNLVKIRSDLSKQLTALKAENSRLKLMLTKKDTSFLNEKLLEDNNNLEKEVESLKSELEKLSKENRDLLEIKDKIVNLQSYISKGAMAYNQNILQKKSEDLIKDIKETLTKKKD